LLLFRECGFTLLLRCAANLAKEVPAPSKHLSVLCKREDVCFPHFDVKDTGVPWDRDNDCLTTSVEKFRTQAEHPIEVLPHCVEVLIVIDEEAEVISTHHLFNAMLHGYRRGPTEARISPLLNVELDRLVIGSLPLAPDDHIAISLQEGLRWSILLDIPFILSGLLDVIAVRLGFGIPDLRLSLPCAEPRLGRRATVPLCAILLFLVFASFLIIIFITIHLGLTVYRGTRLRSIFRAVRPHTARGPPLVASSSVGAPLVLAVILLSLAIVLGIATFIGAAGIRLGGNSPTTTGGLRHARRALRSDFFSWVLVHLINII
jgi:hypothetical protein